MQQETNNATVDIDTSGPGAEIELENESKETETPEVETAQQEETKNEVVEEPDLDEKIKSIFAQGGKEVILVRSEQGADIQKVMRLTDIARKLGIEKISFAVKEPE